MSGVAERPAKAVKRSGPTPEQAQAADPTLSAWVSASAGSGKTFVLARRVLRLLRQGVPPGRILCLTFTKAAAAEMARRVFLQLGRWSVASHEELASELEDLEKKIPDAASLAQARRLFAEALETPGGLKIQTIHAFAERVLHRFPFEANVPAHFEVLDDATASELREQAQGEVLAQAGAEDGGALSRALDVVAACTSDSGFFNLLGSVIARRGELERWIGEQGGIEAALAHLAGLLGADADGDADDMRQRLAEGPHFPPEAWPEAIAVWDSGSPADHKMARALEGALAAAPQARCQAYTSVFFTTTGGPRAKLMTKGLTGKHPGLAETLEREQVRLAAALDRLRAQEAFEASAALLRLGHGVTARYGELKTASGQLDFDDLIAATLGLLTRREAAQWVLYKLDGGIDHILIDEAQDTSPAQWEIVAALAEEALAGTGAREQARTIFAVGDEKQSIYSFQGADPAKFDEMRKFFETRSQAAELGWRVVPLTVSFRSGPAVLEAVDKVFAAPQARAGLAAGETPIVHTPHRADAAGLVEIWPPEEREEKSEPDHWAAPLDRFDMESPRARLARRIAATINHWIAEKKPLEARGRPIQPGDILVLVRKRSEFVNALIAQLRALDIPVAGADRLVVQEHIAVMDLMTAGDVALLPEDDLALATLLKSPLGGLDEEALFELASRREGSLWQELQARRGEARFAAAHALVAGLLARADFTRPYDFFAALLGGSQRGRAALLSRLGPEAGDAINEFLALALRYEQAGAPSLQGFLTWMRAQSKEIKREMDQAAGEVRIMTVHGAKGLEAPIVILPDSCDLPDGRHDGPLLELGDGEGAGALVWARGSKESQPRAISEAREKLQEARLAEYRRLFYVAMTRAEDRLYVCGAQATKEPREGCWHELIRRALGPDLIRGAHEADGGEVWRLVRGKAARTEAPEAIATRPAARQPLPEWALSPAPPPPALIKRITPSRFIAEMETDRDGGQAGGRDWALSRGNLIHRLLELLPDLAEEERGAAASHLLTTLAGELEEKARGAIAGEALALLSEPDLQDLFGPSSRAEVALAGEIDSAKGGTIAISGQIDRLTIGESEIVIADYKSNRAVPERAEDVPPAYVGQLAAYRLLLKKIFPGKAIRALIVWTAAPRAMEVPGATLDAAERSGLAGGGGESLPRPAP